MEPVEILTPKRISIFTYLKSKSGSSNPDGVLMESILRKKGCDRKPPMGKAAASVKCVSSFSTSPSSKQSTTRLRMSSGAESSNSMRAEVGSTAELEYGSVTPG